MKASMPIPDIGEAVDDGLWHGDGPSYPVTERGRIPYCDYEKAMREQYGYWPLNEPLLDHYVPPTVKR
jgi:hypothetical protein